MLSTLVIIVTFLCVGYSAEVRTTSKTFEFPETQILTDYVYNSTKFNIPYARCNSSQPELGKRCVVGLKLDAYENSTDGTRECKVTLKPETSKSSISDNLWLFGFGSDKLILAWVETQNASSSDNSSGWSMLKTIVVHVFDDCQIFENKVHKYPEESMDLPCLQPNIVVFDKTYEVIIKDAINDTCTSGSECTLSYGIYKFDAQAQKLSGPHHWPTPLFNNDTAVNYVAAVEPHRPHDSYFVFNHDVTKIVSYLVLKEQNDYKKLMLWESPYSESVWYSSFSTVNEAVSSCYNDVESNSSFTCWRSNQKGSISLKTEFKFEVERKTYLHASYNLRDGGLLVATSTSPTCGCRDPNLPELYYLLKVSEKGLIGSLEFQLEPECDPDERNINLRLFENKEGQYCVLRSCQSRPYMPARLETLVRCYPSEELSKCMNCL